MILQKAAGVPGCASLQRNQADEAACRYSREDSFIVVAGPDFHPDFSGAHSFFLKFTEESERENATCHKSHIKDPGMDPFSSGIFL